MSELKRLDEEIVKLRTKHDKLHDSNQRKRTELNMLADKLKELHSGSYSAEATPQIRLKEGEEQVTEMGKAVDRWMAPGAQASSATQLIAAATPTAGDGKA